MGSTGLFDRSGRRRSSAIRSGFHEGRIRRNKGLRYPRDPPTVKEIIVLWPAGLRISEALALAETDLDRGGGHRRVVRVWRVATTAFPSPRTPRKI